ncbi:MAG: protein nirF [Burkholderiales bacterium]|nr:protein nirF [Burkholderiales bacterium]
MTAQIHNRSTLFLRLSRALCDSLHRALGGAIHGTALLAVLALQACALQPSTPVGTGDLGVVIERATGKVAIVNTTRLQNLGEVTGLGDLSHASVVFSRDEQYAYVFGRDGGLSKVNLLTRKLEARVMQAGNSIGGAMSQDGRYVAAQNYTPGGVKVFDAQTLTLVADIPAEYAPGKLSRVVGLVDAPTVGQGQRFVFSLFDADEVWIADIPPSGQAPRIQKIQHIGHEPYDGLITPDGRHYIAGLFGEDGLALIDLWAPQPQARKILSGYGRGQEPLPVYKMPHLRGWAVAGRQAYLPAIGRHEVLVVDTETWNETARIPVLGQPVFVMARPDGRQVWVNFAVPDYSRVQVIDTTTRQVVRTLEPGKAVLHMEFTPRADQIWISSRDANLVSVIDPSNFETLQTLPMDAPSGIFLTHRAGRIGF